MQQLLRYGMVHCVTLMIILHPTISRAQSRQLQGIIESVEEIIATVKEIAAVTGIKIEVDEAEASLDRLLEAAQAGADIPLAELPTYLFAIRGALTELHLILQDRPEFLTGIGDGTVADLPIAVPTPPPAELTCDDALLGAAAACSTSSLTCTCVGFIPGCQAAFGACVSTSAACFTATSVAVGTCAAED